ncbi:MAG TPA: NADH-quinone oxidoreductase subunit N [Cytophagaceae bacterium]
MKTLILTAALGLIAMLADILGYKKYLWGIIMVALGAIFYVNLGEWTEGETYFNMITFDRFAVAFSSLLLVLAFIWFAVSKDQYESADFNKADNYALILFALTGTLLLVSFSNLAVLFLGIEILSIPLYILAGSRKNDISSNEASIKYFIMGAFTTGILLFGIALIYGATGTFDIYQIAEFVSKNQGNIPALFYSGMFLLLIALAFKVSAAPFHFWTPDVYEGAPIMITGFMATIVKTAAFAAFFRLFITCFETIAGNWTPTLTVITALTILAGNLLAVYQSSVKRMLAYSGIAQAGYLLLTLIVLNRDTENALLLYTASYSVATLGAFTILYFVQKAKGSDSFDAFNSLGKTHPLMAIVMAVCMLSLAGIPPAIGFFAKFYLFAAVLKADAQHIWIVSLAVIGSLISVYYYFRLIIGMYSKEGELMELKSTPYLRIVLIAIISLIVIIGVTPAVLIDWL